MIPRDLSPGRAPQTAVQFAKRAVLTWGEGAFYWRERIDSDAEPTEREASNIDDAVRRQWDRVRKFLGLE